MLIVIKNVELRLANWLKDGEYRISVLKLLAQKNLLSSELASKLNLNRASMSRILRNLKEKELVDVITSGSRTVTYFITKKGKEALKSV